MIHEETNTDAYAAMVWCLHNSIKAGQYNTYRDFAYTNIHDFADHSNKLQMMRFWDPMGFRDSSQTLGQWWTGVDSGKKIQDSWNVALLCAQYLVSAGDDTEKLQELIPSPFPSDKYIYWTADGLRGDPSDMKIGNSHFSAYYSSSHIKEQTAISGSCASN